MSAANTRNITSSMPSTWNCLTTGMLPISGSFRGIAMLGGRRAQLLHDRDGGQRIVARLRSLRPS